MIPYLRGGTEGNLYGEGGSSSAVMVAAAARGAWLFGFF